MSAYGLQQLIDIPTRECKILDWVLTNIPFAVLSHGILDPISNLDHNPIFIKFNFSLQRRTASKPFIVWDYAKGNFSDLNNALYATPWEFIIMNSPNVDFSILRTLLITLLKPSFLRKLFTLLKEINLGLITSLKL